MVDLADDVAIRYVQRDLIKLKDVFPLDRDQFKPAGWSWRKDGSAFDAPFMDFPEALTFHMIKSFLEPMLPEVCLSEISPYIKRAHNLLKTPEGSKYRAWPSKVSTAHRSQPLIPAKVLPEVMDTVSEVLFKDRQLIGDYQSRSADRPSEHVINPLGLVYSDTRVYLVALWDDDQKPRTLALDRFSSVKMLEVLCQRPENFDLDQYLKDNPIFFPVTDNAKEIELQFKMDKDAALDLEETPLTEHQEFDDSDEETFTISATVQDTQQLRWWLLSYGAQVEIVKPAAMRKEFADITKKMSQLYSDD
jgi:hypothetical protein